MPETGLHEPDPDRKTGSFVNHLVVGFAIALAFLVAYLVLKRAGVIEIIMDSELLHGYVKQAGAYGPFLVMALMAGAIVANPIPSAPIALAAGLAYGHTWGTLYIVIGAVTGALIAFTIARLVGHEILSRWFGDKLKVGLLGSQNTLTSIVFVSRLLPFVSFDIVSYAAGLTEITWWRFTLATTIGIIPASFLLAHFGGEMATGDARRIATSVLALGTLTLIPVLAKVLWSHRKKGKDRNQDPDPT
jgi:uncharacterized membrane protein YdjX (TVP38/TMEM64 family)